MPPTSLMERVRSLNPKFLQGLPLPDLETVVDAARQQKYLANSVVVNEGHPADHLFLLLNGRARFFVIGDNGQKSVLLRLAPGETFGLASLASRPSYYVVSTETVQDSTMLVWQQARLRRCAERYPLLLENSLLAACEYLVVYRALHLLTGRSARERVATVLVNLANGMGERVSGGVELDINNEELANEANVTLFTTSRLMSAWQRNGMVVKSRGKVLLRSPEALLAS